MLINIATHGIFTEGLGQNSVVLDLGANEGEFSRQMVSRFGCTVIAVEPQAEHFTQLTKMRGLRAVCAAVGPSEGWADFHICENHQASSLYPIAGNKYQRVERVRCHTLESILASESVDRADLLKIDIEGAEVELLASFSDERLASFAQITVEFHDFNGTVPARAVDATETRLCALGFHRIQLTRTNRENVLFYNPTKCPVSRCAEWWAKVVTRNTLGFQRVVARSLRRHRQS